ncbi:MAG TPA: LysM peptidoglycan-binding domain-containing protein [Anaerolineales bacterium]
MTKRIFQWMLIGALLVASFASTGSAAAWSGCASYAVVQWGDTLSSLAALCGTTVAAIQAANPGLGSWLLAGQVLYIPTGSTSTSATAYQGQVAGSTYTVQWGDSLGGIAASTGFSTSSILAVNPQIWNANLIYPGEVINLPASASGSSYSGSASSASAAASAELAGALGIPAGYSILKVTNQKGLYIRTGPGINYPTIESPVATAVYHSSFLYTKSSVTVDALGYVWVQITFGQTVNGHSTGWIMVKDGLGTYYTNPNIN